MALRSLSIFRIAYTGVTCHSFNVQTSFCTLSTGLKLPSTHVFVFDREVAL